MNEDRPIPPKVTTIPGREGSLESLLEDIANVVLWLGIAVAIIGSIAPLNLGAVSPLFIAGLLLNTAITTFVLILVLKVVAEILRILKHQANLPYTGEISQPTLVTKITCPKCNTKVTGSPCPACNQKLQNPHI